MALYEIILGVLLIIVSVFIVVFVMLQESKQQGLSGAIAGGSSDTFFGKNKGRTREAKMARLTKYLAIVFFVLVLGTSLLLAFFR
ncbi:MAG: preprotein translocase subunit SecG [Oscillospiraceae bacterium]|jgi:preprotein translocase subunit SecG|nr:preprotein translocase subunit SecG [Oscillospiraceae bacterium]